MQGEDKKVYELPIDPDDPVAEPDTDDDPVAEEDDPDRSDES